MEKFDFIPLIVSEILKFKNPAIWLAESIFVFNLRTRFLLAMLSQQNHKGHHGAWFKPKISTHQWNIFLQNPKISIFMVFLSIISKNEIFFKKFGSVSFLPLRQPNFMRSFRKILCVVLEKTPLPTDILTYWQLWNHNTPFHLKAGVQKVCLVLKKGILCILLVT